MSSEPYPSLSLPGLPGDATAVVVTVGNSEYLPETLAALAAQTRPPARVLVVDAGRDGGAQLPADAPESWRLVATPGARNLGAAVREALTKDAADGGSRGEAATARSVGSDGGSRGDAAAAGAAAAGAAEAGVARSDGGGPDPAQPTPTRSPAARPAPTRWLWLLHDDAAPEPAALAALLRAVEHSPSVAVAGAKQRTWGEPVRLLEAGVTTSRFGRRMTGVDEGEVDQGQLDGRDDVLGVGTAGMLVRADVWAELGGTDPALGPYLDGLDLSRRARLAGHRVVVVPTAVVRHARASFAGLREGDGEPDHRRSFGARRQALLHTQLAWVPLPFVPVVVVLAIVSGALRALWRVVTKEPVLAVADLTAPLWVLARPGRIIAARRAARRTRALPRRSLRLLQNSWRDVYREYRDRRMRRRESQRVVRAPSELELRELATITRRRRVALGALAFVLAVVSWVGLSALVSAVSGGGRLAGGALAPSVPFASWWAAITTGWVPGGLGAPGPADPILLALAPLAAVTRGAPEPLVLLGALLASGLAAWFAAGAATRSLALRWWAALVWAGAPALLLAQGQGRLGAVLAHIMIPWVGLGLARAVGVQRTDVIASGLENADRRGVDEPEADEASTAHAGTPQPDLTSDAHGTPAGSEGSAATNATTPPTPTGEDPGAERWRGSLGAAAAAGLALAVATAGSPVLLPAGLLILLVVALVTPRRRGRVLFVAVPALVVHAQVVIDAARGSTSALRTLLGDPGLPLASHLAPVWQQLLGWPVEPVAGASVLPELPWAGWAWLTGGVLVVVALAALLRGRDVARGVRVGWWAVACGLLVAGVSGRIEVAAGEDVLVRGWSGAGVSVVVAGLLLAAILGADGVRDRLGSRTFGWRQPIVAVLAIVAVAGPALHLGAWALDARAQRPGLVGERLVVALESPLVPAVGRQAQHGAQSARVLMLAPGAAPAGGSAGTGAGVGAGSGATQAADDAGVRWQLLRGNGPAPTDRSVAVAARGLEGELTSAVLAPAEPQLEAIDEIVAHIAAGSAGDVSGPLAERAVAVVLLPPTSDSLPASARARLEGQLDATQGLERIASNETGTMWRVAVVDGETEVVGGSAWAQVVVADGGRTPVESTGLTVATDIPAGPSGRVLVLAESADPGWRARLDGRHLRVVQSDWRVAFELPAEGGRLEVEYDPADRQPRLVMLTVVLGLTVLLALPVRRRRGVVQ